MPTFEYSATNASGELVKGNVFGTNLEFALNDLKNKGLNVDSINVARFANDPLAQPGAGRAPGAMKSAQPQAVPGERGEIPRLESERLAAETAQVANPGLLGPRSYIATSVTGPVIGRVPLHILGFFFRQLGTMLAAGVPLNQILFTLGNQQRDVRMKHIVEELKVHVQEGRPMSWGLQRYPESITPIMLALVRVGEESGTLDKCCHMIADYIDREVKLRNLYKRLTFLPKLELAGAIVIVAVANAIIESIGSTQTIATPFTLATWGIIVFVAIGVWLFLRVGLANPRIRYVYDTMLLKVPVLGKTMQMLSMAKFGRAFGALYEAGVPIVRAAHLSADACGNENLRNRMYREFDNMGEGSGVYETFRKTEAFSPIVLDMVHTGETTGQMTEMVEKVSEYYEGDAETRQAALATAVGLVVYLMVAIYIGWIVIHFWTGYYGNMMKAAG